MKWYLIIVILALACLVFMLVPDPLESYENQTDIYCTNCYGSITVYSNVYCEHCFNSNGYQNCTMTHT